MREQRGQKRQERGGRRGERREERGEERRDRRGGGRGEKREERERIGERMKLDLSFLVGLARGLLLSLRCTCHVSAFVDPIRFQRQLPELAYCNSKIRKPRV